MKTKNLLLGLALSALALQSCNVLDIDPTDTYSESTAYASIKKPGSLCQKFLWRVL